MISRVALNFISVLPTNVFLSKNLLLLLSSLISGENGDYSFIIIVLHAPLPCAQRFLQAGDKLCIGLTRQLIHSLPTLARQCSEQVIVVLEDSSLRLAK